MIVKVRLGARRKRRPKPSKNQHLVLEVAALLIPTAVMALVLALWKLAADLKITGAFPIAVGVFSHWQTWLAAAVFLELCAIELNRYGKPEAAFQESVDTREENLVNSRF